MTKINGLADIEAASVVSRPGGILCSNADVEGYKAMLPVQTAPFDAATVRGVLDPSDCTYVEFLPTHQLYATVKEYVVKNLSSDSVSNPGKGNAQSFGAELQKKTLPPEEQASSMTANGGLRDVWQVSLSLGLGLFEFSWKGQTLYALNQRVGTVGKSRRGPDFFSSLVILARGRGQEDLLRDFFSDVHSATQGKEETNSYVFYQWNLDCQYWRCKGSVPARTVSSVILPDATKKHILEDLTDFLSTSTYEFYANHGIPYRRSYLFYGLPGSGKTSFLQAIAGQFDRRLCFLQPSHPKMTDDGLRAAMESLPSRSIVVLEDIDALFHQREAKGASNSSLTFSGLLNALDGVGASSGQIYVLTTNHRERLDPALTRHGRVDVHVEFSAMTDEQTKGMFSSFYPSAGPDVVETFARTLRESLGDRVLSPASLQHYFVCKRKAGAEEAAASAAEVADLIDSHTGAKDAAKKDKERKEQKKADESGKEAEKKSESKEGAKKPEEKAGADKAAPKASTAEAAPAVVHVHLHGITASGGAASS